MLGGDTRDDYELPTILGLSSEPVYDPMQVLQPLESTDLLCATDAFLLQNQLLGNAQNLQARLPKTTILRLISASGKLLKKAEVKFFDGSSVEPFAILADSGSGIVTLADRAGTVFPNFTSLEKAFIRIEASKDGQVATSLLRGWQLLDATARGSQDIALVPINLRLPDAKIVRNTNLALNRSFQNEVEPNVALQLVTDGQISTGATIPPSEKSRTFTLDLGKDRFVGEVEFNVKGNKIWDHFQVKIQETGLSIENARFWAAEVSGAKTLAKFGKMSEGISSIQYYGNPVVARFILVTIPPTKMEVKLQEIKVHSFQQ